MSVMSGDPEELDETTACVECGATLMLDGDQSFAYAPGAYLCFECAERRGGVFDASEDRWTAPPDVSGLVDERRPHP